MLKALDLFSMLSAAQVNAEGNQNIDAVYEGDSEEDSDFVTVNEPEYDDLFASDNSNLREEENAGLSESHVNVGAGIRLPCVAHSMQLVLKDAVKKVPLAEKVSKEVSAAVVFFHRSLYWGNRAEKVDWWTNAHRLL